MSDLVVKVIRIDEVLDHPNADKLQIIKFGGWQIVASKDTYQVGQTAVHIPPECLVSQKWATEWGVQNYLIWHKKDLSFIADMGLGRVKTIKLRTISSYGFLVPNESGAPLDSDLAAHYGIIKYEPPEPQDPGQCARENPLFARYTDIQNLRNYRDKLNYYEPVIITEKLHGMNSRVGFVWNNETGSYEKVIGSHRTQKKLDYPGSFNVPFEKYEKEIAAAFAEIALVTMKDITTQSVIFYGEIIGPSVQDLKYGLQTKDWRVFDIAVNGTYLPFSYVKEICEKHNVPMVPHMMPGVYSFEQLCALAEGESKLCPGQIKEGIVVKPMGETTWGNGTQDPNPKRMIFKVISSDYLCRKHGTEYH